jgi:hypothetical protein
MGFRLAGVLPHGRKLTPRLSDSGLGRYGRRPFARALGGIVPKSSAGAAANG